MKQITTEIRKTLKKERTKILKETKKIFKQLCIEYKLNDNIIERPSYAKLCRMFVNNSFVFLNDDELIEYELVAEQLRIQYTINTEEQRFIVNTQNLGWDKIRASVVG